MIEDEFVLSPDRLKGEKKKTGAPIADGGAVGPKWIRPKTARQSPALAITTEPRVTAAVNAHAPTCATLPNPISNAGRTADKKDRSIRAKALARAAPTCHDALTNLSSSSKVLFSFSDLELLLLELEM